MTETAPEEKPVRRRERRSWLSAVPLLVIPLLPYVAFAGAGADFDIELLKAARGRGASITENALSMMVFAACLILFLIWDKTATSTFFLLTLMSLVDVIAAFAVTVNAARREYGTRGPA
jgi:hypothetical protein